MDEATKRIIKINEAIHEMWKMWAKDILTKSKINPDGSRTIPTAVIREYVDAIMENDVVALAAKYEKEFQNIISTLLLDEEE